MLIDFKGIYAQQAKCTRSLIRESKLSLAIQDNIFKDYPPIVDKYPVNFFYLNVPDEFKFIYNNGNLCLDFTFVSNFLNSLIGVLSEEGLDNLTRDITQVCDLMFSHHVVNLFRQDDIRLLDRIANQGTLIFANESLAVINMDLRFKYGYTLTHIFKSYLGINQFGFSRLYLPDDDRQIEERFNKGK